MAGAIAGFPVTLTSLPDARIDYWLGLALHAVQVERKYRADELYLRRAEPHEILIDTADYLDSDDARLEANERNLDRWADLAEIATFHALTEAWAAMAATSELPDAP